MSVIQLNISMLGSAAGRLLQGNPTATITGVTSRGVFVRLNERGIVFLSSEAHHGPLTLNLTGDPGPLLKLAPGEPAMMTADSLVFPALDLDVLFGEALAWQAPLPPRAPVSASHSRALLRETVAEISASVDEPDGYPGLLPDLRRLLARAPVDKEDAGPFLGLLKRLSRSVWDGQPAAVVSALVEFLGRGSGLTPSGDDLALGFLLALKRWGRELNAGIQIDSIAGAVIETAFLRTTTLAANLIQCAADGQADERLITALDGLIAGEPGAAIRAAYLRSWGSSSGIDALAGMAAVLLAAREPESTAA